MALVIPSSISRPVTLPASIGSAGVHCGEMMDGDFEDLFEDLR